jgi:hypothetical protein
LDFFASHYNDESSGVGLELKKIQLAYQNYEGMGVGKYCLDQENLMMMMCSHTYMKGRLRRIINWLCQWKSQIAVLPF